VASRHEEGGGRGKGGLRGWKLRKKIEAGYYRKAVQEQTGSSWDKSPSSALAFEINLGVDFFN